MDDTGIEEGYIIASLIGAAATIGTAVYEEGQRPKPPKPGAAPGKVPTAEQAATDTAAIQRRALQRRSLESLRIDPANSPGIQVPAP